MDLFHFLDDLHERVERTWWGVVATDSRYSLLWEANYAAVEAIDPDLSLREVREVLHPALRKARAGHEHIWLIQPQETGRLLADLAAESQALHWDSLMRHGHRPSVPALTQPVAEVTSLDDAFWEWQRLAHREFGIIEPPVVEQLQRWEREMMAPAGKRWFVVRSGPDVAGIGSVLVHGGAAYIDNVVTFPAFRRQGVAGSIVAAMLREAKSAGAGDTYLFADQPEPIRLYRRLGFEIAERVATSLAPLPGPQEVVGRSIPFGHSTGSGPGRPR